MYFLIHYFNVKQQQYKALILTASPSIPSPGDNLPLFYYIPQYIWVIGILGIILTLVLTFLLTHKLSQKPTLAPNVNLRLDTKDDQLYLPLLKSKNMTNEKEVFRYLKPYFQEENISLVLSFWHFGMGLIALTLTYIANLVTIVTGWSNEIFLLIGIILFLLITLIGLKARKIIFIFYSFLLSWFIFAISLSGRYLFPDQLLFMFLWMFFIHLGMLLIKLNSREVNDVNNINSNLSPFDLFISSIFIIFFLSFTRPFLPLLGSFFVLLIIPTIYLLIRKGLGFNGLFGCLMGVSITFLTLYFWLLAILQKIHPNIQSFIPTLADFFSQYLLPKLNINATYPNPLLVSIFMGLNVFLFLTVMNSYQAVQRNFKWLIKRLGWQQRLPEAFICEQCGNSMERLLFPNLETYLSSPQQVAVALGSLECFAWKCNTCQPILPPPKIHLRSYLHRQSSEGDDLEFLDCPVCIEATFVKNEVVLKKPTWSEGGEKLIHYECACCGYIEEENIPLMAIPLPKNVLLLSPHHLRSNFTFDLLTELFGEVNRPVHCQECSHQMTETPPVYWQSFLTPSQTIAQQIGSLRVKAFYCQKCGQSPTESHLCFYRCDTDGFKYCPTCDDVTITIEEHTIIPATKEHPGKGCRYERCHGCGTQKEEYYDIPQGSDGNGTGEDD